MQNIIHGILEQQKGQSLSVRRAQGSKYQVQFTTLDLEKRKAGEDSGREANLGIVLGMAWRKSLQKCYLSKQ